MRAVDGGVQAVVIAAGNEVGVIQKIITGEQAGTLFLLHNGQDSDSEDTNGFDRSTSVDVEKGMSIQYLLPSYKYIIS